MTMQFRQAEKAKAKLRLALEGPSGSGKTYTALALAQGLVGDGRFAVIDTEHGSASLYADTFRFDVLELDEFSPETYVKAIHAAEAGGYAAVVIDSLSHAWEGTGGALEMADKAAKRSNSGNSYMAWRDVTPHHNALVEAMVGSRIHVIATMRVKTEYVIEEQNGKKVPRRVGLAPVQRAGMEYEFTVLGDLNREHELMISKTRMPFLDGAVIAKPGAELAQSMLTWLDSGAEPPNRPAPPPTQAAEFQPAAPNTNGNRSERAKDPRQATATFIAFCRSIWPKADNAELEREMRQAFEVPNGQKIGDWMQQVGAPQAMARAKARAELRRRETPSKELEDVIG